MNKRLSAFLLSVFSFQLFSFFSIAAAPLRWDASIERPAFVDFAVYQGETIALTPRLLTYGAAVSLTNATATLYWQTNGMAAAWWTAPATVSTTEPGRISATWAPTNDVGAAQYSFFIRATLADSSSVYRAFGTLTMRASPGYAPTAAPAPGYQWVSPADMQAAIDAATNPVPSWIAAATNPIPAAIAAATNPIPAQTAAAITAATNPIPSWITAATNPIPSWITAATNPIPAQTAAAIAAATNPIPAQTAAAIVAFSKRPRQRYAQIGDSLTAANSFSIEAPQYNSYNAANGYFNWMRAFLPYECTLVTNVAVGGTTTALMLSAQVPQVLEADADIVLICGGVNDLAGGVQAASVVANFTNMITALTAVGKHVVVLTVPPLDIDTGITQTNRALINEAIAGFPSLYKNVVAVDLDSALLDMSTGKLAAGLSYNASVHWGGVGAAKVGAAVASVIRDTFPAGTARHWSVAKSPYTVMADPGFTNTAAWTQSGATWSIFPVPSLDYIGCNKLMLVHTNPANFFGSYAEILEQSSSGRFSGGDSVKLTADIEYKMPNYLSYTNKSDIYPTVAFKPRRADDSFQTQAYAMLQGSASYYNVTNAPLNVRGVFSTGWIKLDPTVNKLYVQLGYNGPFMFGTTVTVHRVSMQRQP
jgi:hypothetical protein